MAGSDVFSRKHRRDEPHQLLFPAGEATPSKKRKPGTEQTPRNAAADDDGMPTRFEQRIAEGTRVRRERAAAASRRLHASAAPAEGSMDFKYPVVSKMMAAMGYKPGTGLGKVEQGILAPLEGVLRPTHAGLGSVEETRPFFCGKENLPPAPAPAAVPAEDEELERPRCSKKAGGRKDLVLTKNALLATRVEEEQHEQPMVVQKVLDMRGPHARVLTDLRGLNDEQGMEVDEDVPMPELQYNLRVLVDEAAVDIRSLDAHLRREQENVASLTRDKETFAEHEASQAHEQVTEAIAGALEQVQVDDAAGVLTPGALLETFRELKAHHEAEFGLYGVAWIACEFARPLLVRAFHGWQPLHDWSFGLELMSPWKDFLCQPYDFNSDGADPYTQLVHDVILPAVRASGTNSWDARDPEPMLRFLETWERLLPPALPELILEDVIMPKLSTAIDSWDPENVPVHVWVHPWLPTLGKIRTEALCHSVRYQLSASALRTWQAHDGSAYAVLSPWKGVFDSESWDAMMARYIVPKLTYAEGHGLKFMPRAGKFYNGVPVYEFGSVRVCVDSVKRLLYAQIQGSWSAVTLAQLMEMNGMARPC